VRDQRQIVANRHGLDLEIARPDQLAFALERTPNLRARHCSGVIEGERREERQKGIQLRVFSTWIGALFGAVP
jgi:hypothetical protein